MAQELKAEIDERIAKVKTIADAINLAFDFGREYADCIEWASPISADLYLKGMEALAEKWTKEWKHLNGCLDTLYHEWTDGLFDDDDDEEDEDD